MTHLVVAESTAVFSDCRRYRYSLTRRFADGPAVMFVGLNPSTADEHADDPTIRRCLGFARRWGYGTLVMANLYAWRATDPRELVTATAPVTGETYPWGNVNDIKIALAAVDVDLVVAAWGADPGPIPSRPARVLDLVGECVALALTKDGHPRHPLYVKGDVEPIPFASTPAHTRPTKEER